METSVAQNQSEVKHHIESLLDKLKLQEALPLARSFHTQNPNDGEANLLLARSMVLDGNIKDAVPIAQRAYDLMPNSAAAAYLAGSLYLDLQIYELAAPILRKAVQVMPQSGVIHWAMADFYSAIYRVEDAKSHYEKALTLMIAHPQLHDVKFAYARCLEMNNDRLAADEVYSGFKGQRAKARMALLYRSELRLHKLDTPVGQEVLRIVNNPATSVGERVNFLLSLGNMYESTKDFDKAFETWTKARSYQDKGTSIVWVAQQKKICRFYSSALLKSLRDSGHPSERPLFIAGMPRSGTTLTEQILASHSSVTGVGEMGRMEIGNDLYMERYNQPKALELMQKEARSGFLNQMGEDYLAFLNVITDKPSRFVVDKMPTQFSAMGYIHLCFPKAKFIHCQRHPADSFISSHQHPFNEMHTYAFGQKRYAEAYLAKQAFIKHWKSIFPERIFELKYERLVENPREVVTEMLAFLGLEFEDACLKFFESGRAVKTFSKDQVRKAVYTTSKERWLNYEKHLGPLFSELAKAGFNYTKQ